jgi:hypothetical protein
MAPTSSALAPLESGASLLPTIRLQRQTLKRAFPTTIKPATPVKRAMEQTVLKTEFTTGVHRLVSGANERSVRETTEKMRQGVAELDTLIADLTEHVSPEVIQQLVVAKDNYAITQLNAQTATSQQLARVQQQAAALLELGDDFWHRTGEWERFKRGLSFGVSDLYDLGETLSLPELLVNLATLGQLATNRVRQIQSHRHALMTQRINGEMIDAEFIEQED